MAAQQKHLLFSAALLQTLLISTSQAMGDVKLKFAKELWCNPSLVEYDGSYLSAIKTTSFK
jgi:hypothetical protein